MTQMKAYNTVGAGDRNAMPHCGIMTNYSPMSLFCRFEEKNQTFEQLDLQLRRLHTSTEALAEYRKNLAQSTGILSKSLAILSGSEDNSALSSAIAQLSSDSIYSKRKAKRVKV